MDAHYVFMLGVIIAYFRYYFLMALNISYQSNSYNLKKSNEVISISEEHYKSCLKKSKKELRYFLIQSSYTLPAILFFVGFGGLGFVESLAASLVSSQTSSSLAEGIVFFCIIILFFLFFEFISDYYTTFIKRHKVSGREFADRRNKVTFFKDYLGYAIISILATSLFLFCFYALVYFFPSDWLWVFFFLLFSYQLLSISFFLYLSP